MELGVVYVSDDGEIQDSWSTLVNPGRDVGPTRIHGITASDILDAPRFEDLAPYVLRAVTGRTIVAHNAPFDLRFLAHELQRAGLSTTPPSGLCTMQWSTAYLHAPSRRLIDCCRASGIQLDHAHSALADATATAQLLGHYLQLSDRQPPWGEILQASRNHPWPAFDGPYPAVGMVARTARSAVQDAWMGSVVSQMPRAADARTDSYLAVLETALLDGVIDTEEQAALVSLAHESGLTRQHVLRIHHQYVLDMAKVATYDHVVTDAEHAELVRTSHILGLGPDDLEHALAVAWREAKSGHSSPRRESTAGITLEPGDRVSFTGDMRVERPLWEARAQAAGLTTGGVTKTAKLLVSSDPNSLSGKANKARSYGVPIVSEGAFEGLITDVERSSLPPSVTTGGPA
ncbi:hypothetical protein ASG73_04680 [Janibacter sp. Soil728]|nr:hypothetical protein ASG73_04680 [Janibacter sp. Soil728]